MKNLLTGSEIVSMVQGLISAKKQQGAYSIDLTVKNISKLNLGGSLDFGGSEFQEASAGILLPEKKSPEEPYGWWKLYPGVYLIRFNEKIESPTPGIILIFPHERLIAAGSSHAPLAVEKLDENVCVLFHVGNEGLSVKQNARFSKAFVVAGQT